MALKSLKATQDLSTDAMSEEFSFSHAVRLVTVYVHADALITEDISIYFDSIDGSDWDTLLCAQSLEEESDFVYAAPGDIGLNEGDRLRVEVTNANGTGNVYVTVKADWRI